MSNPSGAKPSSPPRIPSPNRALLVDLEILVRDRRAALKKTLVTRRILSDSPEDRRRFLCAGLEGTPAQAARRLARGRFPDASLPEAVARDMLEHYAGGEVRPAEGAAELLARTGALVLVTWLPSDAARALLDRLGLSREGIGIYSATPGKAMYPEPAAWQEAMAGESLGAAEPSAVVDNQAACRSALASGLRCLCVPDEWTAFHDFGGADLVAGSLLELGPALDAPR